MVWFQFAFAGSDVAVPVEEIRPTDSVASAGAAYRAATRISKEIVGGCDDLDQLCARALTTPEPLSLRWLLVHMVEETARCAATLTSCASKPTDGSVARPRMLSVFRPGTNGAQGCDVDLGTSPLRTVFLPNPLAQPRPRYRPTAQARGRARPGATVRARMPSVARSAPSEMTGKMAASFQVWSTDDQS